MSEEEDSRAEGEEGSGREAASSGRAARDPDPLSENPALAEKLKGLFRRLDDGPRDGDESGVAPPTLGEFRILREIGSGATATVYEAEQRSLRRRVALKVLAPHLSLSERSVQKFRREAEAGGRQAHPGIVTVFAVGEEHGTHYIAQELVGGGRTLAEDIWKRQREGRLPRGYFRATALLIAEVADALEHAHSCDVIHRDVKPSNILLAEDGRPQVGDFGLARLEDAMALSRSGDVVGTPLYMSPEQATGGRGGIDQRTDVYSLGATLYEALTLERPFFASSAGEILRKILLQEPRDPQRLDPTIPKDLAVICLKAMEKDPRRRYGTMAELAADLRRFHSGEAVLARPIGRLRRCERWVRRHKLPSLAGAATAVAAVALIVLGIQYSVQRGRSERRALARYVPARSALGWDLFGWPANPHVEFRQDPGDPSGHMLAALNRLIRPGAGHLDEVADHLRDCLETCPARGEKHLDADAHYLLGLVTLELARAADPERAAELRAEARRELRRAGSFDVASRETLVLREANPAALLRGELVPKLSELHLDTGHHLVHLHRGIFLFTKLYQGGERNEFLAAIEHLEAARRARPLNATACSILGRVVFFFARSYGFLHLLERAEQLCLESLELPGGDALSLTLATLGQIRLLGGDLEGAAGAFLLALERFPPGEEEDCLAHNALREYGRCLAMNGQLEEARARMLAAERNCQGDPHGQKALAELHLAMDAPLEALSHAQRGVTRRSSSRPHETRIASAILVNVRALLTCGEAPAAWELFGRHMGSAFAAPHSLSRACQLAATAYPAPDAGDRAMQTTVSQIGQYVGSVGIEYEGLASPICYSGQGAVRFWQGNFEYAEQDLERARALRAQWPPHTKERHWLDEACDLYFLAMVRARLSQGESRTETFRREKRAAAEKCFAAAEELLARRGRPAEEADVLDGIRRRALEVLGAR